MATVEERVKDVTARVLNIDPTTIASDANFGADLGAESIQSVELVAMFEEEFGIEFTDDQIVEMMNYRLIRLIVGEASGASA